MNVSFPRSSDHNIDPDILARWSPRSFDNEEISEQQLFNILEAGRWAPSAFNAQPWHFIYARRGTENWQSFVDLLTPSNQGWAKNAAALVFLVSNTTRRDAASGEDLPLYSHSFDAGAAWGLIALQATKLGWHAHGMTGLNFDKARAELEIPDGFRIEAAFAIGRKADKSLLPEALQPREAPSPRKPLGEIISEGRFSIAD
ncbi:nitroreductase family protein [Aureimonas fodinaquatilis]|uniref:Nitroreductase family protein n=1 Tax=Aureimonas fodinaquatilis TaxID=2565783 RepID=A0A5B0DT04_9HYPH|nr:nitroreductase family protein [Aureimonas fodinaquatilis]KAA0969596.1 nitroreductase family protein [Aureimonas fodinaquatilis]